MRNRLCPSWRVLFAAGRWCPRSSPRKPDRPAGAEPVQAWWLKSPSRRPIRGRAGSAWCLAKRLRRRWPRHRVSYFTFRPPPLVASERRGASQALFLLLPPALDHLRGLSVLLGHLREAPLVVSDSPGPECHSGLSRKSSSRGFSGLSSVDVVCRLEGGRAGRAWWRIWWAPTGSSVRPRPGGLGGAILPSPIKPLSIMRRACPLRHLPFGGTAVVKNEPPAERRGRGPPASERPREDQPRR